MNEPLAADPLAEYRGLALAALTPAPHPPPERLLRALRALADDAAPAGPAAPAVIGPYRMLRECGRGGMGVVYEAADPGLGRHVAVKVLTAGAFADPRARERFLREARIAAGLRHDHLVPVYAADLTADGTPYLVMPLIAGPTLGQRVRETAGLPPRAAAGCARELADALAAIHAAGVVHRDVKPGNVLLDADGRARLTDFGLALADTASTADGVAGTPAYLSPEQVTRPDAVDGRADVYALGATLYECLTGVPPFRGAPLDLLRLVVEQDPVPPVRLNRAIPLDLQTICLKCLAKEPASRYATAAALRDDLDRFLAGRPVQARPLGAAGRVWRWCRRSPRLAGTSAALAVAVVAGVGTGAALWHRAERNATLARETAAREQRQRETAEANLEAALGVVDRFCVRVSEDELLRVPGVEPVRRKLLADAVGHYKQFIADRRDDPRALRLVAGALDRLSAIHLVLGELDDALAARREALAAHEALLAADPAARDRREAVAEDWLQLSLCHAAARRTDEAVAAGNRAVAQFAALAAETGTGAHARKQAEALLAVGAAALQNTTGDYATPFRDAVRLLEALAAADPAHADTKRLLANALSSVATQRMTAEDVPALERVRALRAELVVAAPDSPHRRFDLAQVNMNLGVLYKWGGKPAESRTAYTAAAATLERLVADSPTVVTWRRHLARAHYNLFRLNEDDGRPADAVAALRASCEHFDRLTAGHAPEPGLLLEAGTAWAKLAEWSARAPDRATAAALAARLATAVRELHGVTDLTTVQNDRLTLHLVAPTARTWLALDRTGDATALASAHAKYLAACAPDRVSATARKELFRVRAEAAAAGDASALLGVVDEWVTAFPTDADELATAARACALADAGAPKDLQLRAELLFRQAAERGWAVPEGWRQDPRLARFFK